MGTAYGVSNCLLWLDSGLGLFSDAGTTPITDGGLVAQWNDQSGAGNNCTQSTTGHKPTYSSRASNGRPSLIFSDTTPLGGSTSSMVIPSGVTFDRKSFTLIMVLRNVQAQCSASGFGTPFSLGDGGTHFIIIGSDVVDQSVGVFTENSVTQHPAQQFAFPSNFSLQGLRNNTSGSGSITDICAFINNAIKSTTTALTTTTGNNPAGGNLGSFGGTSNGFQGEIQEVLVFSSEIGDAAFINISNCLRRKYNLSHSQNQIVCVGDSITSGLGSLTQQLAQGEEWPTLLGNSLPPGVHVINYGIASAALGVNTPSITVPTNFFTPTQIDAMYDATDFAGNYCIVWAGTNDLVSNSQTAAATFALLQTYCTARQTAGYNVVVITCLSRVDASGPQAAQIAAYNALIKSTGNSLNWIVVDIASDPAFSNTSNVNYYATDGIHPTAAGNARIAQLMQQVLLPKMQPSLYALAGGGGIIGGNV